MRLRTAAVVFSALAAGCSCGQKQGALQVLAHFDALTPGCIEVRADDGAGHTDSVQLNRSQLSKPGQAMIGVGRKDGWGPQVTLTLSSFERTCGTTAIDAQTATKTFPKTGVEVWELTVHLVDADGDGRVGLSQGGSDCDDTNAARYVGAPERCDQPADNDCDGLAGCEDADCDGAACDDGLACTTDDRCTSRACAGTTVSCNTPPPGPCWRSPGSCRADGGCTYGVNVAQACAMADGGAGSCFSDGSCRVGEANCSDGVDNDSDSATDCADSDCLNQACEDSDGCTVSDLCATVSATGCTGSPNPCNTPPAGQCWLDAGSCAFGACQYAGAAGRTCNDGNPCTGTGPSPDTCTAGGTCQGGGAVSCTTPPNTRCYSSPGLCNTSSGACDYSQFATGTACNDQNGCTYGDSCNGGGTCIGTSYTCTPGECQSPSGATCLGDGGCSFNPLSGPCDGGTCAGGVCVRPDAGADAGTDGGSDAGFPYTPDNFDPTTLTLPATATTVTCNLTFNSTNGTFTGCAVSPLPTVTAVGSVSVLATRGLTIASSGSLTLVGDRPVVLAVFGDALIDGPVSASSRLGARTGAGSRAVAACGAQAGGDGRSTGKGGGGGGAGYSTDGGVGGYGDNGGSGAEGGDAGLAFAGGDVPLRGGCPGGAGATDSTPTAGGSGGGAVQISVAGLLKVTSTISASGAGGEGGDVGSDPGGGGGGSGGVINLEGNRVEITSSARLAANGGGGGGGAQGGTASPGQDGSETSATPAAGGPKEGGGGNGGPGGAGATPPVAGVNDGKGGGGGGGATGKIYVRHHGVATSTNCVWGPPQVESPPARLTSCP